MPGVNCAVVGCGTSRRTKGIGIFKLPAAKNDKYKRWREEWLSEITKTRVIDKAFREKILNDTQARRNWGGAGWEELQPPRFLLNSVFHRLKKIELK